MATTVTGSLALTVKLFETDSTGLRSGPLTHLFDAFAGLQLLNGTGSAQIDKVWSSKDRSLNASTGENHDLAGGVNDSFGNAITLAKLKLLVIHNSGTTSIRVSRPANGIPLFSGTTDGLDILAGGFLVYYDPVGAALTGGTGDLIRVLNNSGSTAAAYSILVAGATA